MNTQTIFDLFSDLPFSLFQPLNKLLSSLNIANEFGLAVISIVLAYITREKMMQRSMFWMVLFAMLYYFAFKYLRVI